MKKGLFKLIGLIAMTCALSGAYAEPNFLEEFDVPAAKKEIETIRLEFLNNRLDYQVLHHAEKKLASIRKAAEACIIKNEKSLNELKVLLDTSGVESLSAEDENLKFLEKEKQLLLNQIAGCGVIKYKAGDLEHSVVDAMEELSLDQNLFKKMPEWKKEPISGFFGFALSAGMLYQTSGLETLVHPLNMAALGIIFLLSLLLAYWAYHLCVYMFGNLTWSKPLLVSLKRHLPILMVLFGINTFLYWVFQDIVPKPILVLFTQLLLIYTIMYTFIRVNLIALTHNKRWFSSRLKKQIIWSLTLLLTIVSIGSFAAEATKEHLVRYTFLMIHPLRYLAFVSLSFVWVIGLGLHIVTHRHHYSPIKLWTIRTVVVLCFAVIITAAFLDYNYFAIFFIHNLILTALVLFLVAEGTYLLTCTYKILHDNKHPTSKKIHAWLGMPPKTKLIEFFILRLLLNASIIYHAVIFLSLQWGTPRYYIDRLSYYLVDGFYMFGIPIEIIRILHGLSVFCIIMLLGRFVGASVSRSQAFVHEKKAQNVIVTLIHYTAFVLGAFIMFIMSGGNLGSFALVAGTLSIGIGFGLKGIAGDLVSGIILLLSRSIRPGDCVVVDDIEGVVLKIRILSTEIRTHTQTNVMIPNAYFLRHSVTHYTEKNTSSGVACHVMLKDVNDLERAKKVLLKVAEKHPDVVTTGKGKPEVLVELKPARATLDIILTLRCGIRNLENLQRITSDLNIEILKSFKAADIAIKNK